MKEKLEAFQKFYLYTSKKPSIEKIEGYMKKNFKKVLTDEDKETMERIITEEEIEAIINKLKIGKRPGTDGLGPEYYNLKRFLYQI